LHIAAGLPWCGRRVEQGGVVYCVLEGGHGFRNRVAAWRGHRGLDAYELPFVAAPYAMNLLDPAGDTEHLIKVITDAAARMGMPVKLVVIDTLARALAGGNENAPEDMGALVVNMDQVRSQTKAAVLFIHHSGKDQAKGARGHSSLQAAVDTEIEVIEDAEGGTRFATVVKQRELRKGDAFPFTLRVVELGLNRHGEPVTTCVVEAGSDAEGGRPTNPAERRGPAQSHLMGHPRRALEVLTSLVATSGQGGHSGVPDGHNSVPEQWWRDHFYERAMPGAEDDTKKKAFRRAADRLVASNIVGMSAKRVWLCSRKEGH
jgi:hypothetical protein